MVMLCAGQLLNGKVQGFLQEWTRELGTERLLENYGYESQHQDPSGGTWFAITTRESSEIWFGREHHLLFLLVIICFNVSMPPLLDCELHGPETTSVLLMNVSLAHGTGLANREHWVNT